VIVPCYNEKRGIVQTVRELRGVLADSGPYELIVVDDGSTDGSAELLAQEVRHDPSLCVLTHAENRGYGASLKTGVLYASADLVVITDADGTYPNDRIPELLEAARTADMVVGARTASDVVYPFLRKIPKTFLRAYSSWLARRNIPDINSGLRVFPRDVAKQFLNILPDGFSFTTTITLAMMINHYAVEYVPISYAPRLGKSKIQPIRDTLRFLRLVICTGMYFAPMRVLFPIAGMWLACFGLSACYDIFVLNDLTQKTLVLLTLGTNTLLFTLLADMIVKKTSESVYAQGMRTHRERIPSVRVAGPLRSADQGPWRDDEAKAA
jgi:glycosyltransferase involved in cell wall biosynthesis